MVLKNRVSTLFLKEMNNRIEKGNLSAEKGSLSIEKGLLVLEVNAALSSDQKRESFRQGRCCREVVYYDRGDDRYILVRQEPSGETRHFVFSDFREVWNSLQYRDAGVVTWYRCLFGFRDFQGEVRPRLRRYCERREPFCDIAVALGVGLD